MGDGETLAAIVDEAVAAELLLGATETDREGVAAGDEPVDAEALADDEILGATVPVAVMEGGTGEGDAELVVEATTSSDREARAS